MMNAKYYKNRHKDRYRIEKSGRITMELGQVCLRRGEEQDIKQGRLRLYDNEIDWYDDT